MSDQSRSQSRPKVKGSETGKLPTIAAHYHYHYYVETKEGEGKRKDKSKTEQKKKKKKKHKSPKRSLVLINTTGGNRKRTVGDR